MTQTFPLALDFFSGLSPAKCTFYLPPALKVSRTRGGSIITAKTAERLWVGSVTLPFMGNRDAAVISAQLSSLSESGRTLLARSLPFSGPRADPEGSIMGAALPTIQTLAANSRELKIAGLPSNYVLSAGDYLSFTYGSDPVRYAFHQIVVGGAASAAGLTPLIEVTPDIRVGAVTGTTVELIEPFFKAILTPTQHGTYTSLFAEDITFQLLQSLG